MLIQVVCNAFERSQQHVLQMSECCNESCSSGWVVLYLVECTAVAPGDHCFGRLLGIRSCCLQEHVMFYTTYRPRPPIADCCNEVCSSFWAMLFSSDKFAIVLLSTDLERSTGIRSCNRKHVPFLKQVGTKASTSLDTEMKHAAQAGLCCICETKLLLHQLKNALGMP